MSEWSNKQHMTTWQAICTILLLAKSHIDFCFRRKSKMASAVKVAVRMRPLNEREKILNSKVIVTMNPETTFLQVSLGYLTFSSQLVSYRVSHVCIGDSNILDFNLTVPPGSE